SRQLRPAGLSHGAAHRVDPSVRGDSIAWIEPGETRPGLDPLMAVFVALRDTLNREAYLGLDRIEVQIARYPGGGTRYDRHQAARSTPPGSPNGRVTAIYSATPAWRPGHGGLLRLHVASNPQDIAPVLDRLLVFLSERVEHEVLPAEVPRRAVTA